jgi:hypothetical protein
MQRLAGWFILTEEALSKENTLRQMSDNAVMIKYECFIGRIDAISQHFLYL